MDTGVLLLHVVGSIDPGRVDSFKRTQSQGYRAEDFQVLQQFVAPFQRSLSTPNILTEASNLLKGGSEAETQAYRTALRRYVEAVDERYLPATPIVAEPAYLKLGLTDAGLVQHAIKAGILVLTDDAQLAGWLYHLNADVVNFTHLRGLDRGRSGRSGLTTAPSARAGPPAGAS